MLEACALTKRYHGSAAAKAVSFRVVPGEVLGLLGPNGAGKSTTLQMLCGLLEPSAGEVLYAGKPISGDPVAHKRRLGLVPEEPIFYSYLSGREHLQLVGRLRGVPEPTLDARIERFLGLLQLLPQQSAAIESYSKGMRQKLAIASALLHDPEILLFDEAESGLDLTSALVFRGLIARLAARGKIVLYSSHVLEIVERVCSRALILREGRVLAELELQRARSLDPGRSLEAVFRQLALGPEIEATAGALADAMSLA
jgi:ABC-2 type transport system ATP-binding protein